MQQFPEATHPFPTSDSSSTGSATGGNGGEPPSGLQATVDQAKQSVASALTTIQEQTAGVAHTVTHRIQSRPLTAVAIAAATGFALGLAYAIARQASDNQGMRNLLSRLHW